MGILYKNNFSDNNFSPFSLIEQVLEAAAVWSLTTHQQKLSKLDKPDMWDTAGEVQMSS